MTKKKQEKEIDSYKKEDIDTAEYIMGNEMRKCSDEIFEVLNDEI